MQNNKIPILSDPIVPGFITTSTNMVDMLQNWKDVKPTKRPYVDRTAKKPVKSDTSKPEYVPVQQKPTPTRREVEYVKPTEEDNLDDILNTNTMEEMNKRNIEFQKQQKA